MRKLGLLLLLCAACGAKKPAPKEPAAPPAASQPDDKQPAPDAGKPAPVQRTGDPCDGGEKPR